MSWGTFAFLAWVGWISGAIIGRAARVTPYGNLLECLRRVSQSPLTAIVMQQTSAHGIFNTLLAKSTVHGTWPFEQTTMWLRVALVMVASGILLACEIAGSDGTHSN